MTIIMTMSIYQGRKEAIAKSVEETEIKARSISMITSWNKKLNHHRASIKSNKSLV